MITDYTAPVGAVSDVVLLLRLGDMVGGVEGADHHVGALVVLPALHQVPLIHRKLLRQPRQGGRVPGYAPQ